MAVIKERIITTLKELPDDATLEEIERNLITKTFPPALLHTKKVGKYVQKLEKLSHELSKIIQKSENNPRYLQETISIDKVRNTFYTERNFHIR